MRYDLRQERDRLAVTLHGDVTMDDHGSFRAVIAQIDGQKPREVCYDVTDVGHIDAAGLGMVLLSADAARTAGSALVLRGAKGQVARVLASHRLSRLMRVE